MRDPENSTRWQTRQLQTTKAATPSRFEAFRDADLLDMLRNERTLPAILTTSQKLSTGVDALNVRNIVLMRPIKSMIEFKQIIGRGTRMFDGKFFFTVYDFVKAHEHFRDPEWDGEPEPPEVPDTPNQPPPAPYPEPLDPKPPGGIEEDGGKAQDLLSGHHQLLVTRG